MTRERMIELLCETICAERAQAEAALEAKGGDVLAAARLLQRQAQAREAGAAQKGGAKARGGLLRRLLGRLAAVRPAFAASR